MKATDDVRSSPEATDWRQIEAAVEAFEHAYHDHGTADPNDFCGAPGNSLYVPLLRELLRADLEFAWSAGRVKRIDEYRARFPQLFADPASVRAIAFEEYRLRVQAGETVSLTDYETRYDIDTTGWTGDDNPSVDPTSVFAPSIVRGLFAPAASNGSDVDDVFSLVPERFPEPGDSFLGFKLVRELGRGAFARVFLAEQVDMANRLVALKVSAQTQHESQTLARLQHTNIVPIYSTHEAGRFSAICMPFFGATTLADVLHRIHHQHSVPLSAAGILSTVAERKASSTIVTAPGAAPIPADEPAPLAHPVVTPLDHLRSLTHTDAVLWIGAELAEGLAFAHDRGIIHRDLKPANVLIADDGRPMLLDFNLAANENERQEYAGGTPSHMAPEQLKALKGQRPTADPRSDLYSLGLILYELLTGRLPSPLPTGPFQERIDTLLADRAKLPSRAAKHNPTVTPAVDAILAKCLAPDPAQRYATAHQLGEDIRRQLNHQPLAHTREPSLRERIQKKIRRNPWVKSVPFLAAVVLLAVGITTTVVVTTARERERVEAVGQFQEFRPKAVSVQHRLSFPDYDLAQLARDTAEARATLAVYGLPNSTEWLESPHVRRLNSDQTTQLRESVSELLLFLAHAEVTLGTGAPDAKRQERFAEAERLNKLAVEAAPDARHRWAASRQQAALHQLAGRKDNAKAILDQLGTPPAGPDAVMFRMLEAQSRRDYRGALAILRDADSETTTRPDYWYAKGRLHTELSEFAAAVSAYTTALALQPEDNYHLFAFRARAHFEQRDYPAAIRDFDEAIRLRPEEASNHVDRALAKFRNKDTDGALADLARALELNPGHTRSFFIRRQVRLQAKDRDGAAADLAEGLKQTPKDETSWITRGVHKLNAKDATGAVADFDEALKLNPTSKRALQNKASALSEYLTKPEDAIRVLDELLDYHPDYINARAGRGVLLARLGKRDAAHADAKETLKRDSAAFTKYQVAGIFALTSKTHPADRGEAFRLLAQGFQAGADSRLERGDHDLDPVRTDPTFRKLIDSVRTLEGLAGQ